MGGQQLKAVGIADAKSQCGLVMVGRDGDAATAFHGVFKPVGQQGVFLGVALLMAVVLDIAQAQALLHTLQIWREVHGDACTQYRAGLKLLLRRNLPGNRQVVITLLVAQQFFACVHTKGRQLHRRPGRLAVQRERGACRVDHVELVGQLFDIEPRRFASGFGLRGVGSQQGVVDDLFGLQRAGLRFELVKKAHVFPVYVSNSPVVRVDAHSKVVTKSHP